MIAAMARVNISFCVELEGQFYEVIVKKYFDKDSHSIEVRRFLSKTLGIGALFEDPAAMIFPESKIGKKIIKAVKKELRRGFKI